VALLFAMTGSPNYHTNVQALFSMKSLDLVELKSTFVIEHEGSSQKDSQIRLNFREIKKNFKALKFE
jgi:hypothetical protein